MAFSKLEKDWWNYLFFKKPFINSIGIIMWMVHVPRQIFQVLPKKIYVWPRFPVVRINIERWFIERGLNLAHQQLIIVMALLIRFACGKTNSDIWVLLKIMKWSCISSNFYRWMDLLMHFIASLSLFYEDILHLMLGGVTHLLMVFVYS